MKTHIWNKIKTMKNEKDNDKTKKMTFQRKKLHKKN